MMMKEVISFRAVADLIVLKSGHLGPFLSLLKTFIAGISNER